MQKIFQASQQSFDETKYYEDYERENNSYDKFQNNFRRTTKAPAPVFIPRPTRYQNSPEYYQNRHNPTQSPRINTPATQQIRQPRVYHQTQSAYVEQYNVPHNRTQPQKSEIKHKPEYTGHNQLNSKGISYKQVQVIENEVKKGKRYLFLHVIAPILALVIIGAGVFTIYDSFLKRNKTGVSQINSLTETQTRLRDKIVPAKPKTTETTNGQRSNSIRLKKGIGSFLSRQKTKNKLTITSQPSGALFSANGKEIGRTPFTWKNPPMYGTIEITAKLDGYADSKRSIEFLGGTVTSNLDFYRTIQDKNLKTTNELPLTSKPEQLISDAEYFSADIKQTIPTAVPEQKIINKQTPSIVLKKQVKTKQTINPKPKNITTLKGPTGTIYISSIPPGAEVFMDGSRIGLTNKNDLVITPGIHTMLFKKGNKQITKKMTFTTNSNPAVLVKIN